MLDIKNTISRHLTNSKGWTTKRKIVVIESDDWGSIRMPSKQVLDNFLKEGIKVNTDPYCCYDSLESKSDLSDLYEVLSSFKDSKGNYPVITANTVVANPDFEKIKQSDFSNYYYEPFTETLNKLGRADVFSTWKEGIESKLFFPQFHGREHVNVTQWIHFLKNNSIVQFAFEQGCWGLPSSLIKSKINLQASYDMLDKNELNFHQESIKSGLALFESIFGYKSESFIANNFIWDTELETTLKKSGVKYIQGMKYQKLPLLASNKRQLKRHFIGEVNQDGQTYLIRNSTFEPSQRNNRTQEVNDCLKDISAAFMWNKPAIISTHRLNFIGQINQNNKDQNLKLLHKLMSSILIKWPDTEFMNSTQLGALIEETR